MPKAGKNIYKRKDGRWEGRYVKDIVDGRAKYGSVYALSYGEVKQKLDAAKREAAKPQIPICKAGKVSELSRCWLAEATVDLKESSVVKYENMLRCYILPAFGDMELSDITNENLVKFANDLRTSGGIGKKGLAASTVAEIMSTMNALRIYALKRGCSILFTTECVSVKQEKPHIRVFSILEEQQLVTYLHEHMDLTALGILVCLYTGIRVGELCALQWGDINLDERTMRIGRTMQRLRVDGSEGHKTQVKILGAKSASSIRTIPLPDNLVKLLSSHRQYASGAFFLTGRREQFIEPRLIQNRFKRILKKCGIADANFHATRHTFATRCVELGFDAKTLSEILGHASVAITMNKYVHPTMELKAENMNRFMTLFRE